MNSFLMQPATSLADVQSQLSTVISTLLAFNASENSLVTAGFLSLPRTSVLSQPLLYSGQMDIQNLGTEHFAAEFSESPLNNGPVGTPMCMPLATALSTFASVGSVLTTKMVWSFGSSMQEAMQYQNGIIVIASPPPGAVVWDSASYITPLSDESDKIEWTFAPGTSFLVENIVNTTINNQPVTEIYLQVQP